MVTTTTCGASNGKHVCNKAPHVKGAHRRRWTDENGDTWVGYWTGRMDRVSIRPEAQA